MEKATISRLKNRLSAYLKKVKAGVPVVVFERDRPIARIERIAAGVDPRGRLARLEAAGLVRRPSRPLPLKALKARAPASRASVVEALLGERAEGR